MGFLIERGLTCWFLAVFEGFIFLVLLRVGGGVVKGSEGMGGVEGFGVFRLRAMRCASVEMTEFWWLFWWCVERWKEFSVFPMQGAFKR